MNLLRILCIISLVIAPVFCQAADSLDLVARNFQPDFLWIVTGYLMGFAYVVVFVVLPLHIFRWIFKAFLSNGKLP